MNAVVEMAAVTKTYRGGILALNQLELSVPPGGVFGLIGPNGCGKTTTLRVLLGLARADSGEVSVLGRPVPAGLGSIRGRIGALVETPKFFPRYSGRLNLELLAGLKCIARSHVEVVLERVGLTERADDRFGGYSLGMRQRLAVAGAMLGDPDLLILDEPANGLDPAGIAAMREMLASFGSTGRTVLVSSHHLVDVERICDRIAVVAGGATMATGTVQEVIGDRHGVVVTVRELERARQVLSAGGFAVDPGPTPDTISVRGADGESVARVLGTADLYPSELRSSTGGLEEAYLRLTGTDPLAGGHGGIAAPLRDGASHDHGSEA
jgi:ABC-2 type transport system ATP-binding protein